jgi:branched-chain amino acid transport system substrate-binding protein
MSKTSKIVWTIVLVVVAVGLIWWGVSRERSGSNTITIGFIGPLTGDGAPYGQPEQETIELAVNQINAAGGINGKQVVMDYQDGKCDGQDAANAAQKLVNVDGVQAIIGGFCSGETIPAVPIAAAGKVLLLSPAASSPKLTNISPYFFRDYPSDAAQGKVLADVAYNKKGYRSVAIIQEQTDYAEGIYNAFTAEFSADGGKTQMQAFPSDTSDFRSLLTTLKGQRPDALLVDTQTAAAGARILDQMKELGWNVPLLVNDIIGDDPATLTEYHSQLEGAITAEFFPSASTTQYEAFITAYQTAYGQVPPYQNYMATVYDAVNLLVDGIRQVGYNGSALATWSRTISNWPGVSGNITIGADGDRTVGHAPYVIHDGQAIPLAQ